MALLVRQIEIVAWTAVLAGWCLLRPGVAGRTRLLRTATLLVATLPGVAVVLAVNRHVTGSAFEFPFTLVSPDDGIGWGLRRVLPTDAARALRARRRAPHHPAGGVRPRHVDPRRAGPRRRSGHHAVGPAPQPRALAAGRPWPW